MSDLKICTIGHTSCGRTIDFGAKASLDEYDIINIYPYGTNDETQIYSSGSSNRFAALKSCIIHWKTQLKLINNKLIVVYLRDKEEYILKNDAGRYDGYIYNYSFLPFLDITKITNIVGEEVCVSTSSPSIKALHAWLKGNNLFYFQVYLNQDGYTPLFFTRGNQNKLGGIYKDTEHNNIYLLLPGFQQAIFSYAGKSKEYATLLQDIYNELFGESTPEQPDWVKNNPDYLSDIEKDEQNKISENQKKIDEALQKIESSKQLIEKEQNLKTLLFGQSHELEQGILEAMALIGFVNPHTYTTDNCEIDVLCSENDNPGFLLIGEAEGASKGTVNNKKINQLHTHAATYITENDVDTENLSISSVLFGNAFTAMPPEQRDQEYFGQHVYKIANLQNIKLVRTPDLFSAALYIKNTQDQAYAKQCYDLFFDGKSGQIEFPQHS